MKIKYITVLLLALLSLNAKSNSLPFVTTTMNEWKPIEFQIIKACLKNDYKIRSVIVDEKQITCVREEMKNEKLLERVVKINAFQTMIGHQIVANQWFEGEDANGNLKKYNINQDLNKEFAENILEQINY